MIRQFRNIEWGEVSSAIIKMLKELNIAGSTSEYNIYNAIEKEHQKAIKSEISKIIKKECR